MERRIKHKHRFTDGTEYILIDEDQNIFAVDGKGERHILKTYTVSRVMGYVATGQWVEEDDFISWVAEQRSK